MLGKIKNIILVGFISGQLICLGCTHVATIKHEAYRPLLSGKPLEPEVLAHIEHSSPKDAVFADLLQAFALMRTGDITKTAVRKDILNLLTTSVNSFEDMTDPVNFSVAFSGDEDKPFRGRPHERMFSSIMAGVFHMADNNCAMALPFLRNAEFLDARFQKMPFGTDAPLVYSLMYRCLKSQNADAHDISRAADGVYRSLRFLSLQEPLVDAMVAMARADLRPMAIANRMAYMLFEISIYHTLISAPNDTSVEGLVEHAAQNASIFMSTLGDQLQDDFKSRISPLIGELSRVYRMGKKEGEKHLQDLAFSQVSLEVKRIGDTLVSVLHKHPQIKQALHEAMEKTAKLNQQVLHAASAPKMRLSFSGMGPTLELAGSYQEIAVVKKSPTANPTSDVRRKNMVMPSHCGMDRDKQGDFFVVLCDKSVTHSSVEPPAMMPALELLSLSRKATTAQGRHFDKILKGRAQFRAATENVAEISAWSALFLFYLGSSIMSECQRQGGGEACMARAFAVWTVACATAIFSGTVWLIGRASNPASDSRFIPLMYESTWVAI